MIEVAIMIEGQNGLSWQSWKRIASAVESSGYAGLFRSDHITNANPPDKDSLECWTSLTWLATSTRRIEFGPLVSPVSVRHPVILARMAAAVDDLSGGRLVLGIGAGWQEREHTNFGFDLLPHKERFTRFEEGVDIVSSLLNNDQPVTFSGKYFILHEASLLPRPLRPGGPPLLIGGNGAKRTLPLAAKYASEWNAAFPTLEEFRQLNLQLDGLLKAQGRQPENVRRSMVAGCVYGSTREEVEKKVSLRTHGQYSVEDLRKRGMIVGTAQEIIEQCQVRSEAGVQRIMLQWLDLEDIRGIESMAAGIINKLS